MKTTLKIVGTILVIALIAFAIDMATVSDPVPQAAAPFQAGAVGYQTAPTFIRASSTAFTLTTSSLRLLASSTPTKRLAATVQPVNCTAGGQVFMMANNDAAAVASTGIAAYASTTFAFEDYPNTPVVQGSVQGITNVGTCTVLVTEWRSQY